jgi:hypothetical protein
MYLLASKVFPRLNRLKKLGRGIKSIASLRWTDMVFFYTVLESVDYKSEKCPLLRLIVGDTYIGGAGRVGRY